MFWDNCRWLNGKHSYIVSWEHMNWFKWFTQLTHQFANISGFYLFNCIQKSIFMIFTPIFSILSLKYSILFCKLM